MGQIKNIKLHIVTDIKQHQLIQLIEANKQTKMSLPRTSFGIRSALQSVAKVRVAAIPSTLRNARCLATIPLHTTTTTIPSLLTQRHYGSHEIDYTDMTKDFLMLFDKIDPAKLSDDARLCADLGLDSLDIVEVAIMLADEFGLDISDVEMDTMHDFTVKCLCDFVATKRDC